LFTNTSATVSVISSYRIGPNVNKQVKNRRDSKKITAKNSKKTRQTFVKMAKITAKARHQIAGPKTIIKSIKLSI